MKKVSIAILCYDGYIYTNQLLMDIHRNCKDVHEVIVVDNGSKDDATIGGLNFWLDMNVLPLQVHRLPQNVGFISGMNYALSVMNGDIFILLSNDVRILSSGFIGSIRSSIEETPRSLIGGTVYRGDTGWNCFNGVIYPYAEGYLLAATREAWINLGGFDLDFAPSDFEDVHLSTVAVSKGYKLVELPKHYVQHLGGKSYGYNNERFERTKRNRAIFAKKWGIREA